MIKKIKSEAIKNHVPIIQDEALEELIACSSKSNVKRILEIGTAIGYSAINMALSNKNAHIDTIEINNDLANIANQNISSMNLQDRITVYNCDALEYLNNIHVSYDFIFIDAAKSKYKLYTEKILEKAVKGMVILADDINLLNLVLSDIYPHRKHRTNIFRLREYIDFMQKNKNLKVDIIKKGHGLLKAVVVGED